VAVGLRLMLTKSGKVLKNCCLIMSGLLTAVEEQGDLLTACHEGFEIATRRFVHGIISAD
jgi:hypothetical protein